MEKRHLDQRLAQMAAEGTRFKPGVNVGDDMTGSDLQARYDAVVLAVGATVGRDLPVPGRELGGILQAMDYLPHANRHAKDTSYDVPVSADGKHVVIIGGGDTGADCLGTTHRQGAASVTQLEILPRPADERPDAQPLADLADDLPHVLGPRGGRRPGLRGEHGALRRRRGRPGAVARARRRRAGRGTVHADRGHGARDPGAARAAGHGLHRVRSRTACSPSSASRSTGAATSPATRRSCRPCRACSSPATRAAVSR